MTRCLLGLGSNLGDRRSMMHQATGKVLRLSGCQLLAQSRWYETVPIGGPAGQGGFLNGALLLDCAIPAEDLARALQTIESQLGRNRAVRWDARAIDIDLLLFGGEVIESPGLSVPHPRMSFRRFVLEPAAEIAGYMIDPISGWTLSRLLSYLENAPRYVAVAAEDAVIADWLASELCQELRCPRLGEFFPEKEGTGDLGESAELEFSEWAIARLRKADWEKETELKKRLASNCGESQEVVTPVVSDFWYDEVVASRQLQAVEPSLPMQRGKPLKIEPLAGASILHPALVITVEPDSKENFRKKISLKKIKKPPTFFSIPPQLSLRESLEGHGPMARIRAEDPVVVIQEAIAAIRSVWPELSSSAVPFL